MKAKMQKPVSPKPVSIRINPDTRAQLDFLIERTGLKEPQIIRLAIKRLEELERPLAAAAPKPARKSGVPGDRSTSMGWKSR